MGLKYWNNVVLVESPRIVGGLCKIAGLII